MTNFALQVYLPYKALFSWLNAPDAIIGTALRPLLLLVMFTLVGRFAGHERTEDFLIGMIVFSIPGAINFGIFGAFIYERVSGTLSVLFGTPANRLLMFLSRGILNAPIALIPVAVCLSLGQLLVDLDLSRLDWITMACAVLLITCSCTAYALLFGNIVVVSTEYMNSQTFTNALLLTLTGVIIPTASLPGMLSDVGWFIPITNGLVAFRAAFEGAGVGSVSDYLLRELAVGVAYIVVGYVLFRLVEIEAKRRGNLEAIG